LLRNFYTSSRAPRRAARARRRLRRRLDVDAGVVVVVLARRGRFDRARWTVATRCRARLELRAGTLVDAAIARDSRVSVVI